MTNAWKGDGRIYVTGHDEPKLFVTEIPEAGSNLKCVDTIPIPAEGPTYDWDPTDPGSSGACSRRTVKSSSDESIRWRKQIEATS